MKKILVFLFVLTITVSIAQEVIVTKAQQRYPWNGLVDLEFKVTSNWETNEVRLVATNLLTNTEIKMNTFLDYEDNILEQPFLVSTGMHKVIWNADVDTDNFDRTSIKLDAIICEKQESTVNHHYLVVDLSGGTSVEKFPVSYFSEVPEFSNTHLVLRRIFAGKMPKSCVDIEITKDYYIGVYEVTQKQFELVTGKKPSNYNGHDLFPVENVSYIDIRGENLGSQWPFSNTVDSTSFLGILRAKTGIDFDLPTEAQWEYACRAGSSGSYGLLSDGSPGSIDKMARYDYDGGRIGPVNIGSFTPNAWGLYDMHGNVWEWCLDWYSYNRMPGLDTKGPFMGSFRVLRGGSWNCDPCCCILECRHYESPEVQNCDFGFRVASPTVVDTEKCIAFNSNGGSGSMPIQFFFDQEQIALEKNKFVRPECEFLGWSTTPDGEIVYLDGDYINTPSNEENTTINLYAKWNCYEYSVIFNANGGSGNMPNQVFEYAESQNLETNKFTRPGYEFFGWSTSVNGDISFYDGEKVEKLVPKGSRFINLYAIWRVASLPNVKQGELLNIKIFPDNSLVDVLFFSTQSNAYCEAYSDQSFALCGSKKGWYGDDECWSYDLPFDFPFFGEIKKTIYINSNGTINFDSDNADDNSASQTEFKIRSMIAVLWNDLRIDSGDIFIEESADYITIRWNASYYIDSSEVNCSVTLYKTGKIILSYGSGNKKGGLIGISSGDGKNYLLSPLSQLAMENSCDIIFAIKENLPDGLSFSADGVLTGIISEKGEYNITLYALDTNGQFHEFKYTLNVVGNSNDETNIE